MTIFTQNLQPLYGGVCTEEIMAHGSPDVRCMYAQQFFPLRVKIRLLFPHTELLLRIRIYLGLFCGIYRLQSIFDQVFNFWYHLSINYKIIKLTDTFTYIVCTVQKLRNLCSYIAGFVCERKRLNETFSVCESRDEAKKWQFFYFYLYILGFRWMTNLWIILRCLFICLL